MWLRAHPRKRAALAASAGALALGIALTVPVTRSADGPAEVVRTAPSARYPSAATVPTAGATGAALPPAADVAAAESIATAFLEAYSTYGPDETGAALRARLRPYDTDSFDASLAQGGDAGAAGSAAVGRVVEVASIQTAPDGRLVLVARVDQTQSGSVVSRTVELYLARTPAGWRVSEVLP
jgi:hypothetical protein